MDWDNLRYFLELARSGTLMSAARRLEVGAATIIVEGLYRVRTGKAPTTLLDGVSIVSVATTHPPDLDTRARARVLELEGVRYVLEWL